MNPTRPSRRIHPPHAAAIARRGALFWTLLRTFSLITGAAWTSVTSGAAVVGLTAVLVWLDGRRFHEHLFHANLGTSPAWPASIALAVAAILEVLFQILVGFLMEEDAPALFG